MRPQMKRRTKVPLVSRKTTRSLLELTMMEMMMRAMQMKTERLPVRTMMTKRAMKRPPAVRTRQKRTMRMVMTMVRKRKMRATWQPTEYSLYHHQFNSPKVPKRQNSESTD